MVDSIHERKPRWLIETMLRKETPTTRLSKRPDARAYRPRNLGPVHIREDLVALNVRGMPRSLRQDFKAFCASNNVDMQQGVMLLILDAVVNQRMPKEHVV